MKKIAVIGECMVELYQEQNNLYRQGFAGDTFNFSVYLKRELASSTIEYITVLGKDDLSKNMFQFFKKHNIESSYIDTIANKTPGLFIIKTINGERNFSYWRDSSAAKDLFTTKSTKYISEQILNYDLIYYSAITLAIMSNEGRRNLFNTIKNARQNGVKIVFDSNYRPSLYKSNSEAKDLYNVALNCCDIFLPSIDDEIQLWQDKSYLGVIQRAKELGCNEVVITQGGGDIICYANNKVTTYKTTAIDNVVDTTSAGDSFNAAYVGSRLRGLDLAKSIQNAQILASRVVMHKGAIISQ